MVFARRATDDSRGSMEMGMEMEMAIEMATEMAMAMGRMRSET